MLFCIEDLSLMPSKESPKGARPRFEPGTYLSPIRRANNLTIRHKSEKALEFIAYCWGCESRRVHGHQDMDNDWAHDCLLYSPVGVFDWQGWQVGRPGLTNISCLPPLPPPLIKSVICLPPHQFAPIVLIIKIIELSSPTYTTLRAPAILVWTCRVVAPTVHIVTISGEGDSCLPCWE